MMCIRPQREAARLSGRETSSIGLLALSLSSDACRLTILPIFLWLLASNTLLALLSASASAQTVTASVNLDSQITRFPEYGLGVHSSVYDGALQYTGSPVYSKLPGRLDDAGVNVLRYPGGGYADIFHFSVSRQQWEGGLIGHGFTPWGGTEGNYGWMDSKTDFGNFVKLLDATNSKTVITLNTGGRRVQQLEHTQTQAVQGGCDCGRRIQLSPKLRRIIGSGGSIRGEVDHGRAPGARRNER